jgi:NAD(P)-dependent dehydrogenase (short-subunit alcohol dehydrogenase family)
MKNILVTGGTVNTGLAIVRRFAKEGYGVAITNSGLTIRRMNYGHAMDATKVKIDGWRNLSQATLTLRMEDNVLSIFVGDEQEPVAMIQDSMPFTHGMCGLFSTGKELRVTELSVKPLQ